MGFSHHDFEKAFMRCRQLCGLSALSTHHVHQLLEGIENASLHSGHPLLDRRHILFESCHIPFEDDDLLLNLVETGVYSRSKAI